MTKILGRSIFYCECANLNNKFIHSHSRGALSLSRALLVLGRGCWTIIRARGYAILNIYMNIIDLMAPTTTIQRGNPLYFWNLKYSAIWETPSFHVYLTRKMMRRRRRAVIAVTTLVRLQPAITFASPKRTLHSTSSFCLLWAILYVLYYYSCWRQRRRRLKNKYGEGGY